jgi:hypothetical protein
MYLFGCNVKSLAIEAAQKKTPPALALAACSGRNSKKAAIGQRTLHVPTCSTSRSILTRLQFFYHFFGKQEPSLRPTGLRARTGSVPSFAGKEKS